MDIICPYDKCTGCQACKQICPKEAISMVENERGFIYPIVDNDLCIDCGLCQKKCPSVTPVSKHTPIQVYAGWNKDADDRKTSNSGGISYLLSQYVVSSGGYFCGASWDIDSKCTKHVVTNDVNKLSLYQGSRYSHSDTGDCFKEIRGLLNSGKSVLFTGTPCQVAALKNFLGKEYDNLMTVDLICHGVPSKLTLRDRINTIEKRYNRKVVDMKSREKTPDQLFTSTKYTFEDGSFYRISVFKDPFFRSFVENYTLRPNCFGCEYAGKERVSDITIGDYWGYNPHSLRYRDYQKGNSVIIINTQKGRHILEAISNRLVLDERTYEDAASCNQNLNSPQPCPNNRDEFWKEYISGKTLDDLLDKYYPPIVMRRTFKDKVRIFLKMILPTSLYLKK